jgi:predicted GNAT family N-acyltransferase
VPKLLSKKTYQLSNKEIRAICLLKDTHWKFGLSAQLEWFKKNIKSFDIHNILIINKKLVGYTLLRARKMKINLIRKYLLFDTLIIKKNFRNKKLSKLLMNFNNQIIKKNKKISFLMCGSKLVKFYKKNGWIKINKKNFNVIDHKFNTNGMIFNSTRKYLNINFYTK